MSFVIDTSAIMAILLDESDSELFRHHLDDHLNPLISIATLHELYCVLNRSSLTHGPEQTNTLLLLIEPELVPFDIEQLTVARDAYTAYGRGSGHAANLNMGDCFSYALAKSRNLPLLFKGDDFVHTDIKPALRRP